MKRHFKKTPNYMKLNIIVASLVIVVLLGLTVGYSILSKELDIDTSVTVRADKDIRISSMNNFVSNNNGYEIYGVKYNVLSITANIGLPNIDSTVSYDFTIRNKGSKAMQLKNIVIEALNNDNMTYLIAGISESDVINSGEVRNCTITFKYKDGASLSNIELGSVITFKFDEYVYVKNEYVTGSFAFNLEGINSPVASSWIDSINSKPMMLNNAVYNANKNGYDFSTSGSYGTLGESVIPATGDFTLEVSIRTPDVLDPNADMAIVSQISDTASSDKGRFKVNLAGKKLIIFYNDTKLNDNISVPFVNVAEAATDYLLQVVRSGGTFKLYVNGIQYGSARSYNDQSTISQGPLKLAKWNNSTPQQYTGTIYTTRIYKRALTNDELLNNYNVDKSIYFTDQSSKVLSTYLASNHLVSSGVGLYKTSDGTYKYKGLVTSNYLSFEGDSKVYRIISLGADGAVKLLDESNDINLSFDASGNRTLADSPYCSFAETVTTDSTDYYGCNAFSTNSGFDNVSTDSTIKKYLDTYYTSLPVSIQNRILTHSIPVGAIDEGISYNEMVSQINSKTMSTKMGLLTLLDVIDSSISNIPTIDNYTAMSSFIIKMTNSTSTFWTITPFSSNTYDVWTVIYGTGVGGRRASRLTQNRDGSLGKFYVKPAFYITGNVNVSGIGTATDPFIVLNS